MKILLVAAELAEVVAVGGIAEYALGLGRALAARGHDVRIAIPAYGFLRGASKARVHRPRIVTELGSGMSEVGPVYELRPPKARAAELSCRVFLCGEHRHFASVRGAADVYAWPNHEPWIAFSRAVVDWLLLDEWVPDAIHCQDAHASLIPVYIGALRGGSSALSAARARTVLTVHNLLNQGLGPASLLAYAGLPAQMFHPGMFEFYGGANCLKAGLQSADRASTVSPTYAEDVCRSGEYGFGLEGVLRQLELSGRFRGIMNGISESRWCLPDLAYDGSDSPETVREMKRRRRAEVFADASAEEPVFAFRSRWDSQKGVDLLVAGLDDVLKLGRLAVVTWGTPGSTSELRQQWRRLSEAAALHPRRLLLNPQPLAAVTQTADHYAVSDFLLMPSRYEPAGLAQMECQRFGSIPIVRRTGGLADTVSEVAIDSIPSPNGFVFDETTPAALLAAVRRAVAAFGDGSRRRELIANALRQRNDWSTRVERYEALYAG